MSGFLRLTRTVNLGSCGRIRFSTAQLQGELVHGMEGPCETLMLDRDYRPECIESYVSRAGQVCEHHAPMSCVGCCVPRILRQAVSPSRCLLPEPDQAIIIIITVMMRS